MADDPFARDDAAYVLGALDPQRTQAFEAHLRGCASCRARVAEVAGIVPLLSAVPAGALDEPPDAPSPDALLPDALVPDALPPDTLLAGLLRRAGRRRRRRRVAVLAGVAAAAAVVALVVASLVPAPPGEPAAQRMSALAAVPITATAQVADRAWGTQITLHCRYSGYADAAGRYALTVIGTDGVEHPLGSWALVPGQETVFGSGTDLSRDRIRTVRITSATGAPLLELTVG